MKNFGISQFGPVIGQLDGTQIYEWLLDQNGQRFAYVGLYDTQKDFTLDQLADGDLVMAPGIHYRLIIKEDQL